jgi:hypothetical protein
MSVPTSWLIARPCLQGYRDAAGLWRRRLCRRGRAGQAQHHLHDGRFADVFATFAELAGVAPRAAATARASCRPRWGAQEPGGPLYWEFYEGGFSQASRFGRWKALRSGGKAKPVALYDLASNLGESHDVAAAHPDAVAQAEAIFAKEHVPSALWPVGAKDGE